jgi:pimeloyl-ACP methyl ester carboxylesterase
MAYPLFELGGSGPLVHLAPANGFPPETYTSALEPLLAGHRVVSLPPRALWPDAGPPPERPGSWSEVADDLLEGMRRHDLPPVVAIGHSFGGVASLLAAVREPSRFRALVLLDPTILPPQMMAEVREQQRKGEASFRPLVHGVRKRRDRFESSGEAFDYWRTKPLFSDWPDDEVWCYAKAMLTPSDDGDGFVLRWSAAWEAYYYASFYPDSWEDLDKLDPALPVLVVGGQKSDAFLPASAALLRGKLGSATHVTIPGRGHLFPQSAPAETGRVLTSWLEGLELGSRRGGEILPLDREVGAP